ncbi:MAG: LLM class flavin-dependent oxidoreductase [Pseudomonadota bacterium]|jgi:alkanesulfonate monooxygenase SsuD/methylene tetrahydromethanopterin reductase-like flavin-dependent oxidoreductase (luciferase family)|nr:LLM class flavin-dependent oxidoreductase [Pseudomonadota bacterium]|tara:strand:- start:3953 stop:5143 length:1191 start_codon:yes stop_codon:yes gene_type:complete
MKAFMFHLMPYASLDMSERDKHPSAWITLPNSLYDPKIGHELYNRYLDELELAAEVGFDGVAVNEHHQNAYGLMPSPVVMASSLARRTEKCKLAILGNAFALREHPLTLAEEHAMIDCITAGRLITGFVRGIGAEFYSLAANPTLSHERHMEAHDLVVRAWTETGPFAFEGKHYHFEYVNLWPRPYQDPHPPIWCPSLGSTETIEWAAHPDRKYVYAQNYSPFTNVCKFLDQYREVAASQYGYDASSDQIGWTAPVYIADTDEQAVEEATEHMEALFNKFLYLPFEQLFPPGYMSMQSYKRVAAHKRNITGGAKMETLMENGVVLVGSPETVRKKLIECHQVLGFGTFVALLHFGTLPADKTERNIRLFAEEVLPAIQPLSDNEYRGFEPAQAAAE